MLTLGEGDGGFWGFCADILRTHGVTALLLFGVCLLFYKLIWKVWKSAIDAKDEEIERLVAERDKYQKLVFDRLLTSEIAKGKQK